MKEMRCALLSGVALLLLCAAFNGCKSNKSEGGMTGAGQRGGNPNQITGAGSTFIYPIMTRWIQGFQQSNQAVRINYQSIGSGGGIQQLKKGLVDFGASDAALDDNALKAMAPVIQLPESAGPVCITYNLPDLKQPLKLTPEAVTGIFLGTIKNWQDPVLKKANPGVTLPNSDIVVAHRTEGSGTTNIFTTYLSAVSPEWKQKVGKGISVQWPVGLGGKGSEGVTGVVKQTKGAIGYVELTYAEENNLPVAKVQNVAKEFVAPSSESASAAIEAFSSELAKDVRTPIVNPPASAKNAYPITGLTFLLITKDGQDQARRQNVKNFVKYIITDGQSLATQLHYSPLPKSIVDIDQKLLGDMTANGRPLQ